ncbi:MAG: hypothetical protein ACRBI6_16415 [Acidimicrobiales bacterium]
MVATSPVLRRRHVWRLSKHGHQVAIIDEHDRLVISHRVTRRSAARQLEREARDPAADPVVRWGPRTSVIPLLDIRDVAERQAFGEVDVVTSAARHRLGGWGGRNRTWFVRTLRLRLADLSERAPGDASDGFGSPLVPIGELGDAPLGPNLQLRPRRALIATALNWVWPIAMLAFAGYLRSTSAATWTVVVAVLFAVATTLALGREGLPEPLEVDGEGIRWKSPGPKRQSVAWAEVDRLVGVAPATRWPETTGLTVSVDGRGRLVGPTRFLSRTDKRLLLGVMALHRPDLVMEQSTRGRTTRAGSSSDRRLPVVRIAILENDWRGFVRFAVPLAIAVPLLFIALVAANS